MPRQPSDLAIYNIKHPAMGACQNFLVSVKVSDVDHGTQYPAEAGSKIKALMQKGNF
jgi:hypothetical protein